MALSVTMGFWQVIPATVSNGSQRLSGILSNLAKLLIKPVPIAGFFSAPNEAYATQRGVKRVVLPKAGYKSQKRRDHEWQSWFRQGRRYHAGVEGRISVLKRKHGPGRCLNHGQDGFERWVGWGII